jgi:flagellar operon protein
MSFRVINGKMFSVDPVTKSVTPVSASKSNVDFSNILQKEINNKDGFTLSNHAAQRLKDRNINLDEADMNRINDGLNKAEEKGAKDSLILYKDVVMVASIKNKTIITAVDKASSKDNVFTNIDSVVML